MSHNVIEATVKLRFKQVEGREPAVQAEEVVSDWFDEAHSISVFVEDEQTDNEVKFDLDNYEVEDAIYIA